MESNLYEIRYSNEINEYGLFATQRIPAGTKILQEWAVITDIKSIKDTLIWFGQNNTIETVLPETMKSDLKTKTQTILNGMSDLQKRVKDNEKYDAAMNIHKTRMDENNIYKNDIGSTTVIHPYPELPMELYKKAVSANGTQSDSVLTLLLQRPLHQINTFLHGIVEVQYPDNQAWGPITSLINHGCSPNALVSCFAEPDLEEESLRNVGAVAVYATKTIEAGEEIAIEYASIFGALEHRRNVLRSYGIAKCLCSKCEHEADLTQRSANTNDPAAKEELRTLTGLNVGLHIFFTHTITRLPTFTPAEFFQCLHTILTSFSVTNDYGSSAMTRLYINAVDFAKHHNDNVRVYWLTQQLLGRIRNEYGPSHRMLEYFIVKYHYAALDNPVWNDANRDMLSLVEPWTLSQDDVDLVFMIGCDASSAAYQQLALTPSGRLEAVSYAENLLRVRAAAAAAAAAGDDEEEEASTVQEVEEDGKEKDWVGEEEEEAATTAAVAAADAAALALAASEEKEVEKKARAKAKKREKERKRKEKKRAAAAVVVAAEEGEQDEGEGAAEGE